MSVLTKTLLQCLLAGCALSFALWLLNALVTQLLEFWGKLNPPCNLPVVNLDGWQFEKAKREYLSHLEKYLRIGREKYKETGYMLWSPEGYKIVLPTSLYDEIRLMPDSVASNYAVGMRIFGGYDFLNIGQDMSLVAHVTNSHLLSGLSSLDASPSEEIQAAILRTVPQVDCLNWQDFNAYHAILEGLKTCISTTIFGRELGNDQRIRDSLLDFVRQIPQAGGALRRKPWYAKAFAAELGFIPPVQVARKYIARGKALVARELRAREQVLDHHGEDEKHNDFIQWLYNTNEAEGSPRSLERLGEIAYLAVTPSIHTTSFALLNVIYYLAWFGQYIQPLRDEIDPVWNKCNGILDLATVNRLEKLDSFITEAARHAALLRLICDRNITSKKGHTFSNGLHVHHGATIVLDLQGQETDPELWDHPEEFRPFRFQELRSSSSNNDKQGLTYASTHIKNAMRFGSGRHSCPGRAFASMMMKIFLATLLHEYDIATAPGTEPIKPISTGVTEMFRIDVPVLVRKRGGTEASTK